MRDLRHGLLLAGMIPVLFLTGCGKKGGSTGQATAPDEKKEVQASVSAASSAATEDPEEKYKVAYVRSAQAFSRNDLEGAIKYLDIADQAKPNQANNANLRGAIYTRQRDWLKAEAAFRDSLRLQPDMPMAQFNLGEVLFLNNKYAEARERFQIFINSQPKNDLGMYKIYLCDLLGEIRRRRMNFCPIWSPIPTAPSTISPKPPKRLPNRTRQPEWNTWVRRIVFIRRTPMRLLPILWWKRVI